MWLINVENQKGYFEGESLKTMVTSIAKFFFNDEEIVTPEINEILYIGNFYEAKIGDKGIADFQKELDIECESAAISAKEQGQYEQECRSLIYDRF